MGLEIGRGEGYSPRNVATHCELFLSHKTEGVRSVPKGRWERLRDTYGMDLKWSLWYDFAPERRQAEILKDSLAMLGLVKDDALLLCDGESPVFARRDGELTLNSEEKSSWWGAEQLALVQGAYKLARLPRL